MFDLYFEKDVENDLDFIIQGKNQRLYKIWLYD